MPRPVARPASSSLADTAVALPTRRVTRSTRAVVVVASLALVLVGCSAPKHQATVETAASSGTGEVVDAALQPFYDQTIEWKACGDFECAKAQVPVDYADPASGSLELAVKRAPATGGKPIGSLLINPGGPGASGVQLVDSVVTTFGKDVLAQYDVVGFDPRGVASSNPVTCLDDAAKDALLSKDFDYATDAGIAAAKAAYTEMGAACEANTGPLLGHVDTVSAARDMDVLRAALGDEKLTYLGYSYGTALGATYAGLFPEKVGRMVLDGALDPALTSAELGLGQAVGFEGALRAYVTDCQGGPACPLTGTPDDGLAQIKELLDRARRSPLPTKTDRTVTGTLAFYGIAVTLYDNASWRYLTQALTTAINDNDGSTLLQLADFYNERNADGSFSSNSTEAFTAVNCLDSASSADPAVMQAEAAQLEAAAPTVGYFFGYGGVICAGWPYPPTGKPGPITADGAPPIVVIGTTNDPATPYQWAENLATELSSGVLLTYEGEGHTAYGRSNACILDAVDAYLLKGTVPAEGTRC
ncbi:MAG: alpha/beta hydrolase [Cellulomonas sp.]